MRNLAALLKLSFTGVLVCAFYPHVWTMWVVSVWAIVSGILFSFVDRYDWYLTKAGCDLFGSGILLLALSLIVKFMPFAGADLYVGAMLWFFALYYVVIGLYHVLQIAKNQTYKYPIVWVVGKPLFNYAYLGLENVKGE